MFSRRVLIKLLSFLLCVFYLSPAYPANYNNLIIITNKVNKEAAIGEINKKVLGKYIPVKVTIFNKGNETVSIPDKYYFIDDKDEFYTPNSDLIYETTKRHTTRRAIIWGLVVIGPPSLITVPISISHSITHNSILKDNIDKVNYKKTHVFSGESISSYVFIPKKHKNASAIVIKGVSLDNGETFDLKAPIEGEDL